MAASTQNQGAWMVLDQGAWQNTGATGSSTSSSSSSSHSSSSSSSSSSSHSSSSSSHSSSSSSSSESSSSSSSESSSSSSDSSSSHSSSSSSSVTGVTTIFGDNSEQTTAYPGVQDCDINSITPTHNSGISSNIIVGSYLTSSIYRGLVAFDLESFHDDHPFATITEAKIWFYVEDLT